MGTRGVEGQHFVRPLGPRPRERDTRAADRVTVLVEHFDRELERVWPLAGGGVGVGVEELSSGPRGRDPRAHRLVGRVRHDERRFVGDHAPPAGRLTRRVQRLDLRGRQPQNQRDREEHDRQEGDDTHLPTGYSPRARARARVRARKRDPSTAPSPPPSLSPPGNRTLHDMLPTMIDLFRTIVDLSLGVAAVSKEKAQSVVDELVKRGELTRDAGDKVVDDLVKKGEEARTEMSKTIETKVEEMLGRLNLATKADLEQIELRLSALERGE